LRRLGFPDCWSWLSNYKFMREQARDSKNPVLGHPHLKKKRPFWVKNEAFLAKNGPFGAKEWAKSAVLGYQSVNSQKCK
jgi:hypothetical protein